MDAPQDYKTAGIFMLISGIFTCLISFGLILGLIWVCVGVFWCLTLAMGIVEIVVGAGVMSGNYKPNAKTVSILGLVAAVLCGNLVPGLVMEILATVWLGKPEVGDWMSSQSID